MAVNYQLYLVTDESLSSERLKEVITQSVAGGVTLVQVREKHNDIQSFIAHADMVKTLLSSTDVPLIINDRVDVALAVDADGVHLGQSDMPAELARGLLGKDKIIGLTVESLEELHLAQTLPIDYVGISTVFSTDTKQDTKHVWGISGLEEAMKISRIPVVAIGGINKTNVQAVNNTGVAGIALVSAICHNDDPCSASQEFIALMK